MPNLKEVKNRINSVISTQQITKAMKMVSAAKLRKAQDGIIQLRPYAQKLNSVLINLSSGNESGEDNPYAVTRSVEKVLLIVVTSDRGLCGAFNSNIHKAVIQHIKDNYSEAQEKGNLYILPLGKKGFDFFRKRDYKMINDFREVFSDLSFENVTQAALYAMKEFESGRYDRVDIVYNEFKNVATQILRREQFLPVVPPAESDSTVSDIDYIFQPDKDSILNELIPKSLKVQLFKAVLESNAAEQGARMTAMDKATENAGELLKDLRLSYNRTRQAAITTELTEIVAGAQALG